MEQPGIIKNDAIQGLARTRIALCQCPGADIMEETGRYDFSVKDFSSVQCSQ